MNKVQIAFNALTEFNKKILTDIDERTVVQIMEQIEASDQLSSDVWLAVYELTKEINPSLLRDIQAGNYKRSLTTSDICFLDKNWKVLEAGTLCPHCHHIAKSTE